MERGDLRRAQATYARALELRTGIGDVRGAAADHTNLGLIAQQTKRTSDDVYKELTSNTLGNGHFVPAGVVAATRSQERGYSIISIG